MKELHTAALANIHAQRNKSKMFRNALGFLQGIVADGQINFVELEALHHFMLECAEHIDHGDIVDVLDVTEDLVAKSKIDQASEEDLLSLIDCILEYQCDEDAEHFEKLEEFLGICSGIVSDNVVEQKEAEQIRRWLSQNTRVIEEWPACDIARRLNTFLDDGVLDNNEAKELLDAIKHLVGGSYVETGLTAIGLPSTVRQHLAPSVEFENRTFCFTGQFFFGRRDACEAATQALGGVTKKSVTKELDYLVVGSISSPFWLTSHYGNKIKKVMTMKKKTYPYLVGEDVWRQSLNLS